MVKLRHGTNKATKQDAYRVSVKEIKINLYAKAISHNKETCKFIFLSR